MKILELVPLLKQELSEQEKDYQLREASMQSGFPAGLDVRWEYCHKYLYGHKRRELYFDLADGIARAAAVLTTAVWTGKPDMILYRVIYRYSGGAKRKDWFSHNFAWLLLNRMVDCYENRRIDIFYKDDEGEELVDHVIAELYYESELLFHHLSTRKAPCDGGQM